jgi:hypothetical protein
MPNLFERFLPVGRRVNSAAAGALPGSSFLFQIAR